MQILNEATLPFNQHDACDQCGKRTDGLMTCHYVHDDSTTKLCPDCIEGSGFCKGCGYYSAGLQSFDFSDIPGYCSDCRTQIQDDYDDIDLDAEDPNHYYTEQGDF
jgi:hypothetical protein